MDDKQTNSDFDLNSSSTTLCDPENLLNSVAPRASGDNKSIYFI